MKKDISLALRAVGWTRKGRLLTRTSEDGMTVSYDGKDAFVSHDGRGFSTSVPFDGADSFLFIWQLWSLFAAPSRRRNIVMALCGDGWLPVYGPKLGFAVVRDAGPFHCQVTFDGDEHINIAVTAGKRKIYAYREEILSDCSEAVNTVRRLAVKGEIMGAFV